jgi:hypothetical protein
MTTTSKRWRAADCGPPEHQERAGPGEHESVGNEDLPEQWQAAPSHAVTGPLVIVGSREDISAYACRCPGRIHADERARLQTGVGSLATYRSSSRLCRSGDAPQAGSGGHPARMRRDECRLAAKLGLHPIVNRAAPVQSSQPGRVVRR